MTNKPPYQPLMMAQVRETSLTDLTHVSTFSGAGGTCLGFRLAGFHTLWANDIEAHARTCYEANLTSPIDGRDIRHLTAADILTATDLEVGMLDVFEGSPPCTAFSTAGIRAKGWNQTKDHAGHVQTNVEDLFYDWLRLLDGLRPRAFVAENVAGMVKGVAKGYFKDILRRMKALGYQTDARVLDAQWLGVPQQRQRVIFIGIRNDLGLLPQFPVPWTYRYSVRDVMPWIVDARQIEVFNEPDRVFTDSPSPSVTSVGLGAKRLDQVRVVHDTSGLRHRRRFTINELKRICSFPDDFELVGSYSQQWARLGNSVPPLMAQAIAESVRDVLLTARQAVA